MSKISYFDIEVNPTTEKIESLGFMVEGEKLTTSSTSEVVEVCKRSKPNFICGHNFIDHDKKFLSQTSFNPLFKNVEIIDTLFLSMLLYPNKRTHKLDKPYKTELNIENQPLGDAEQTKELFLFFDKVFDSLDSKLQDTFVSLLYGCEYYQGYFKYKKISPKIADIYDLIKEKVVCDKKTIEDFQNNHPVELSFIISYLFSDSSASISSVILIRYPKIVEMLKTATFAITSFTQAHLEDIAKNEFNFGDEFVFRSFEKESNDLFGANEISQFDIVQTTLEDKSLLAILPTGGGKTFAFQLPALIKAKAYRALTVIISPLQALMKDHVESFKEKNQNFRVVAISGYLSPVERMNLITEIENGVVDILYIAPESLRSNSIFKALRRRVIDRFVIDEAHCFSSWGHDFRHDYYFIANTIKELEKESSFQNKIPVSCFTATAKPEVINDIKKYFFNNLELELEDFIASTKRENLIYKAIAVTNKEDKYEKLITEILNIGKKAMIVYIPQNASLCKKLSEILNSDARLNDLDLVIEPFYAGIDRDIEDGKREGRNKSEILEGFIKNEVNLVVATTAFGMGIDKPDIEAVFHFEQSDSLESFLQESGRGARNQNLTAECIVLYNKEDFDKTFQHINRSKVEYHEIERIVKELKKAKRDDIYISPKQIAQKMGIDVEEAKFEYETMIKTALLELEQAGIVERGRNGYKIFATSVDKEKRDMEYVHQLLDPKKDSEEYKDIYESMILVMQNIIQRSKLDTVEVDDLADIVGIERRVIFEVLYALQKEGLLEFNNDISVMVKKEILDEFEQHFELELKVLGFFEDLDNYTNRFDIRDLNDGTTDLKAVKKIIQSWALLSRLKKNIFSVWFKKNTCSFELEKENLAGLKTLIEARHKVCRFIVDNMLENLDGKDELEFDFSTNKLKLESEQVQKLSLDGFHHSLVYLHDIIDSFKLRQGRLIYYQTFKLSKKETIKERTPYKKNKHYKKSLEPYYGRKIEAVHIQIAFLDRLLLDGWESASGFVKDYFGMNYDEFKKKYGFNEKQIKQPITKEKYKQILQDLNDEQKQIFDDRNNAIMVLAGPGSGKTKTLVHKIASLVTIENNKAEYFLMLAHSRVAVAEFKTRLQKLIGNQVYDMKIYTFHSFALSLLGKKVNKDSQLLKNVIPEATKMILNGEITVPYLQMLVLDEYQDVGDKTYQFIKAIYNQMSKDKRIIAVGDDEQCINNFGSDKADIKFITEFQKDFEEIDDDGYSNFREYELLTNYRSKSNLVDFANKYSEILPDRLKKNRLIANDKKEGYIKIVHYPNGDYIKNLVKAVQADSAETIAVLARNNNEVMTIFSQLVANGLSAKYITDNDGFKLGKLVELQDFVQYWENSTFEEGRKSLEKLYKRSKNYYLANEIIEKFYHEYEDEIGKSEVHFLNLFKEYLNEIESNEFEYSKARVVVSTMHKIKGKEFDSVYICINDNLLENDYDKRLLYVAITRAKEKLFIHTKIQKVLFLNDYADDVNEYTHSDPEPDRVVFIMSLKDIALSDWKSRSGISRSFPLAGENAHIIDNGGGDITIQKDSSQICKFSKSDKSKERLSNTIEEYKAKGYFLEDNVEIENVVMWKNKQNESYRQTLCKIYMSRT